MQKGNASPLSNFPSFLTNGLRPYWPFPGWILYNTRKKNKQNKWYWLSSLSLDFPADYKEQEL